MYISQVKSTYFFGGNSFQGNIVNFYNLSDDYLGDYWTQFKINDAGLELLEMPLNYYKGRGPSIYFDYTSDFTPTLFISQQTAISGDLIYKINGGEKTAITPGELAYHSIFFQDLQPTI